MMFMRLRFLAVLLCVSGFAGGAGADTPAKELFGAKSVAAGLPPAALGSYARGCLAGARQLPLTGEAHQVMRPSRNRNWGHPELVAYLERLSAAAKAQGWPGLLVGDLSQPRGGPMLFGHASHQTGLDADIWLTPMPERVLSGQEREDIPMTSVVNGVAVDPALWSSRHVDLMRTAASHPEVARLFVNPAIKKALCTAETGDRAWLRKVRPWWGHDSHFHVRLSCPEGSQGCEDQDPPPAGDGCGAELQGWLRAAPPPDPDAPPPKKKPPLALGDLPAQCGAVLSAPALALSGMGGEMR